MLNGLDENKYSELALPVGKIKKPVFWYGLLIALVILVIVIGGLSIYIKKNGISKWPTVRQASISDFTSTYLNINDTDLPVGTNILLNPMLKNWSVRVTGVIINKNSNSFILENKKNGYKDENIEIKECSNRKDIFFKIVKIINGTKQSNNARLDQLSVGTTMNGIGDVVQLQNEKWMVCGTYFIINEQ